MFVKELSGSGFDSSCSHSLSCSTFSISIKYAEVTPTNKKDGKTDTENYHPISISHNLNKVIRD